MVADGSNICPTSSAIVPSKCDMEANSSGSVVSRSIHQAGCRAPSTTVRRVTDGGMVSPLRTSRRRGPGTGVSTVRTSAS